MRQEGYVNAEGAPIVHKEIDKKTLMIRIGIVALVVFIIIFIFIIVQKSSKNKKCNKIEDTIESAALSSAREQKILPTVEGKSVTLDIDDLIKDGTLSSEEANNGKDACKGKVTITKYKEDYHMAVNLTGCGFCATEERYGNWKESDKMPSGNVYVELVPSYNYYTFETNYGMWSDYLTEDQLESKKDKKYKINLPKQMDLIPEAPVDAHIVTIEEEKKNYYRYQDKMWKFYSNPNANCSAYSSEQPSGYATKDETSQIESDPSPWSLSYPDEKDYRSITREIGYRWYYMDGKKKVYWKNGKYAVEQPGEKYTEKDNESPMYSYTDLMWRWCNGATRRYISYSSVTNSSFPYRDDETMITTSWSSYDEESRLDDTNRGYRTEEIQVRSRFRYKYDIYSLPLLDNYVSASKFEQTVGTTLEEFVKQPNVKVEVKYTYKYRKA